MSHVSGRLQGGDGSEVGVRRKGTPAVGVIRERLRTRSDIKKVEPRKKRTTGGDMGRTRVDGTVYRLRMRKRRSFFGEESVGFTLIVERTIREQRVVRGNL